MRWAAGVLVAMLALLAMLALVGCERSVRSLYEQPRYDPGEPSALWPDGKAMREPVPGTVVHAAGDLAATSGGRRGERVPQAQHEAELRAALPPLTLQQLQRGRERYTIHCLPCHSALGDGDGPVVRRGFPRPPSYHEPRLRDAPDRHFFDVITQGYGIMVPYADRVTPEDRWAIVAYIRALQLSQHARVDELPPPLQASLMRARPAQGAASAPEGMR